MPERSVRHDSFVIERTYPATPSRVFEAWADADARDIWMDDPDHKSDGSSYELDFRAGGHERFGGINPEGRTYRYDALIYDIVPDRRIVYSYEMHEGEDRTSVSLTTVEIAPEQRGATLTYTEQAVLLDGIEKPGDREQGWLVILDNLGTYLAERAAG